MLFTRWWAYSDRLGGLGRRFGGVEGQALRLYDWLLCERDTLFNSGWGGWGGGEYCFFFLNEDLYCILVGPNVRHLSGRLRKRVVAVLKITVGWLIRLIRLIG